MQYVIPKFEGEHHFLSNFHSSPIPITLPSGEEVVFPTAEHMFQALKYKAMSEDDAKMPYVMSIIDNPAPNHAKRMGRKVKIDTAKWGGIKIQMMRETVWKKFKANPGLVTKLLDTGPAMLVEGNNHGDEFWGRVDGKGFNMLGCILMEVRGAYRWNGATQTWTTETSMTRMT